jgi:hypothetical protein
VQDIYPERETVVNYVSLSRARMTLRVEDIVSDFLNKLRNKAKELEIFCLALDDSNDTSDIAQLLIFISGIRESF